MWRDGIPKFPMVEIEDVTIVNRMSGLFQAASVFDYRIAETGKLKRYAG
jgi:hypothetical protein